MASKITWAGVRLPLLVTAALVVAPVARGSAVAHGSVAHGAWVSQAAGSGCGGCGNGKTLSVLVGKNLVYATLQQQWMQQMSGQFQQLTGAKVAWDTFNGSSDEQTRLQTSIVSGHGPDIFAVGTTFVPTAQSTNSFHTLSAADWALAGGKSRFFSQQLTMSGSSSSKQIAVPFVMRPFAMVYNTALFKKAGIAAPPQTWTQFVQDAKKMTNSAGGVYGAAIDPSDTFDPWKIWWTFARQLGGDFVSKDLKTATLNSSAAQQAVRFWFDWATTYHIVDPHALTWKAADVTRAFAGGKVGMYIMTTTSIVPTLEKSAVKGAYAFAPMPAVPYGMQQRPRGGVPASTIVSGDMMAVPEYSTVKDLAYRFINMLTTNQNQLQYTKDFGDLPANASAADGLAHASATDAAFIKAEQGASPTPFTGAWGPIEVTLAGVSSKLADEVATGRYDPSHVAQLLAQANVQAQGQIQQGS